MRRVVWVVSLLTITLQGCSFFKTGASAHPLEFVGTDAAVVVELRDIGLLIDLRATVTKNFSGVVSEAQIEQLGDNLALTFGFDPTKPEGLKSVGLASKGPVAGELSTDGLRALWVVPVADPKLLLPVIEDVMKARFGVDEVQTEKREGVSVTTYSTEFGPRTVVRGAHAMSKGHLLFATGPDAADSVARASKLDPKRSVRNHPEFRAIASNLGNDYDIRMISHQGGAAALTAARRAGGDPQELAPLLQRVTSAGWTLQYDGETVRVAGRARLNDAGLQDVRRVFATKGSAPGGVRAVNLPSAVFVAQASGDPQALLNAVARPGSALRRELEQGARRAKAEIDIDPLQELVPLLSGHAVVSVGTADLSTVELRELQRGPLERLWVGFSTSVSDSAAVSKVEGTISAQMRAQGLRVKERKVGNSQIRDILPREGALNTAPLVSTFQHEGAWGFSIEPTVANAIVTNDRGTDALNGRPGLHAELRVDRLIAELRRFRAQQLDLAERFMFMTTLNYLSLIKQLTVDVEPVDDGLRMQTELQFSPLAARNP